MEKPLTNQDIMNKDEQTKKTEKGSRAGTSEESAASAEKAEVTTRSRRQATIDQSANADNARSDTRLRCASTPVKKSTIVDLKEKLRKLQLPTTENKIELQRRLAEYEQAREDDTNSDIQNNTIIPNVGPNDRRMTRLRARIIKKNRVTTVMKTKKERKEVMRSEERAARRDDQNGMIKCYFKTPQM